MSELTVKDLTNIAALFAVAHSHVRIARKHNKPISIPAIMENAVHLIAAPLERTQDAQAYAEQKLSELTSRYEGLADKHTTIVAQVVRLTNQLRTKDEEIEGLLQNISEKEEELEDLRKNEGKMLCTLDISDDVMTSARAEIDRVSAEFKDKFTKRIADLENSKQKSDYLNEQLNAENTRLLNERIAEQTRNENLLNDINTLKHHNCTQATSIEDLQGQLKRSQEANGMLVKVNLGIEREREALEKENEELVETDDVLRTEKAELEKKIEVLLEALAKLDGDLAQLQDLNSRQQDDIATLRTMREQHEEAITRVTRELHTTLEVLNAVRSDLVHVATERDTARDERDELEEELEEKNNTLRSENGMELQVCMDLLDTYDITSEDKGGGLLNLEDRLKFALETLEDARGTVRSSRTDLFELTQKINAAESAFHGILQELGRTDAPAPRQDELMGRAPVVAWMSALVERYHAAPFEKALEAEVLRGQVEELKSALAQSKQSGFMPVRKSQLFPSLDDLAAETPTLPELIGGLDLSEAVEALCDPRLSLPECPSDSGHGVDVFEIAMDGLEHGYKNDCSEDTGDMDSAEGLNV